MQNVSSLSAAGFWCFGKRGVLKFPKCIKLDVKKSDVVKQFSQLGVKVHDMKTHFELTIQRQSKDGIKTL